MINNTMSLNIYTIKHPLVLNWTSCLLNTPVKEFEKFELIHKIGLALIYESTRRSINTVNLYVKKLDYLQDIHLRSSKFLYTVIIEIYLSQVLSKDILSLIPNTRLCSISISSPNYLQEVYTDLQSASEHRDKSIVVIVESLNQHQIIPIIEMVKKVQGSLDNLQICCLTCSSEALQDLGAKYTYLNIYTTKIIDGRRI
jgi:uracil phosphoribosyltransferase